MPLATCARRRFIGALVTLPVWADARARPGAPALLLAHDAPPDVDPAGHLVSEKLDGVRAFWDGRQLFFRSGLPIAAPGWFTERLPARALDGELWLGRGRFEALSGTVRRAQPRDDEWQAVRYMVFELPCGDGPFAARAAALRQIVGQAAWPQLAAVAQSVITSRTELQRRLDETVAAGGEGLMLHRADAPYVTGRSVTLLKLKPWQDAEATVIAHLPGKGRHEGRLGALQVRLADGRRFQIGTGFTDAQRDRPPPVGSVVTFSYRGTTEAGLPRFASFLRERSL